MKAQVAMEYIMTYGWALLAVMALVAGLSFFGIFKPEDTLAENCYISADIICEDYTVYTIEGNPSYEYLEVYIRNTNKQDFKVTKLQCEIGEEYEVGTFDASIFDGSDYNAIIDSSTGLLKTNRYVKVRCGGPVTNTDEMAHKGTKIRAKIIMDVNTDTSFTHQETGELVAVVK